MKTDFDHNENYAKAKRKVRQIKIFYIHVAGYAISMGLIIWNLCIVSGPYADFFTWFNTFCIVAWTVIIALHGWTVFKGRLFFKEKWQDRKIQEFMEDQNETTMWE